MGKSLWPEIKLKSVFLFLFAVVAVIWATLPPSLVFTSESICIHYRLSGLLCPFCGLSRAAYDVMHFRLSDAWTLNPLIFYLIWLYAIEWLYLFNLPYIITIRKASWWAALGLVVILYSVRVLGGI